MDRRSEAIAVFQQVRKKLVADEEERQVQQLVKQVLGSAVWKCMLVGVFADWCQHPDNNPRCTCGKRWCNVAPLLSALFPPWTDASRVHVHVRAVPALHNMRVA